MKPSLVLSSYSFLVTERVLIFWSLWDMCCSMQRLGERVTDVGYREVYPEWWFVLTVFLE